tara:strand:- start:1342 stop:1554 length:213 start_codon:yes stop_codon:yes gene_type:complete
MTIQLNEDLKKGLENKKIKTVDLIKFLIDKGFQTSKELYKTALKDLTFENKKVIGANFDPAKCELIIELK